MEYLIVGIVWIVSMVLGLWIVKRELGEFSLKDFTIFLIFGPVALVCMLIGFGLADAEQLFKG